MKSTNTVTGGGRGGKKEKEENPEAATEQVKT